MEQILLELAQVKVRWYVWPLLGITLAMASWVILSAKVRTAHAKTVREKLGFFLAPWVPRSMVVIDKSIFYDGEYKVVKGEDSYLIQTSDAREFSTEFNPDETARIVNIWGARGPEDVDAPYSLGWRWVVASMILVYFTSLGLLVALKDPRMSALSWLYIMGVDVPSELTLKITQERALNTAISAVFFAMVFSWWFGNMIKLSAKQTKKSVYITVSSGDTAKLLPALDPDSPNSVFRVLRDKIVINVSDDVRKKLDEIARKAHLDMETLVEIFSKARLADYWQEQSAKLLENIDDYKLAAEAEATLKMQAVTPRLVRSMTKILVLTAIGMLIIGLLVGWGLGSTWGVDVQPTTTTVATETGVPFETVNSTITITPAPPPPPPIGE